MFSGELTSLRQIARSHAVDANAEVVRQCSRKKLFCDGLSPCGSCSGGGRGHVCLRYVDSNDARRTPCEF
jgi:hypothetical protein